MQGFNYYKLNKKHKRLYVFNQFMLFASLIGCFFLALHLCKVDLPTNEERLKIPFGFIMLGFIVLMAFMNRLKALFKIKFVGFLIVFLTALLLQSVIDTIVLGTGLILIPLAVDDLILKVMWRNVWYNEYEQ